MPNNTPSAPASGTTALTGRSPVGTWELVTDTWVGELAISWSAARRRGPDRLSAVDDPTRRGSLPAAGFIPRAPPKPRVETGRSTEESALGLSQSPLWAAP